MLLTNTLPGDSLAPKTETSVAGEATAPVVSNQPLTTVALAESNFDFGNNKKGEKVNHVYEITNTGKNPLVIQK